MSYHRVPCPQTQQKPRQSLCQAMDLKAILTTMMSMENGVDDSIAVYRVDSRSPEMKEAKKKKKKKKQAQ
jgi:hypothetical protein